MVFRDSDENKMLCAITEIGTGVIGVAAILFPCGICSDGFGPGALTIVFSSVNGRW